MPERKEKAQLLQDEDSAQLSVKQPGEAEVPVQAGQVREAHLARMRACGSLHAPSANCSPALQPPGQDGTWSPAAGASATHLPCSLGSAGQGWARPASTLCTRAAQAAAEGREDQQRLCMQGGVVGAAMPESSEKAQLLRDEDSGHLYVKEPGREEVPLGGPPVRPPPPHTGLAQRMPGEAT